MKFFLGIKYCSTYKKASKKPKNSQVSLCRYFKCLLDRCGVYNHLKKKLYFSSWISTLAAWTYFQLRNLLSMIIFHLCQNLAARCPFIWALLLSQLLRLWNWPFESLLRSSNPNQKGKSNPKDLFKKPFWGTFKQLGISGLLSQRYIMKQNRATSNNLVSVVEYFNKSHW